MQKTCYIIFSLITVLTINFSRAQVSPLDSILMAQMNSSHSPGLSALILKKGIPIWVGAYGYAKLEDSIPVTITTDFMLASTSKTITGTAIMNVFEIGAFELDDNINDFLPFTVINPNFPDDTISIRQLLTHTSSIKDNWIVLNSMYVNGDSPIPLGDFMKEYLSSGGQYYDPAKNFYNFHPGTDFKYCNEAVALCGYLVEILTGIPFDQYCNDSIFTPLCMDQTGWFLSSIDTSNLAMPYTWQGGSYEAAGFYGYPDYPDGQLRTNAISLARFLDMYMNNGEYNGIRILDSATVALMLSLQIPSIEPTQGIIWYQNTIGGRTCWGHNGGDIGVSTNMFFSPADSTGIILLSNGGYYTNSVMDAMFDYAEGLEPSAGSVFDCDFIYTNTSQPKINESVPAFPNPSEGVFYVRIPANQETVLSVYDIQGNLIIHRKLAGSTSVDLTNSPNGMYLMQIKNGGNINWSKLIKQ